MFTRCRPAPASIFRRLGPVLSSRSWRWVPRRRSIPPSGAAVASTPALALTACVYGFARGGPPHIKTVAVLPFGKQTPEPPPTQDVNDAGLPALHGPPRRRAGGGGQ